MGMGVVIEELRPARGDHRSGGKVDVEPPRALANRFSF
jgi:hypothetical protein